MLFYVLLIDSIECNYSLEILAIAIQFFKHFISADHFGKKYWNIKLGINEPKRLY